MDRRADIWAFGAVVFEMLTGRRAFAGATVSEVLAEVLKTEPNWEHLPRETPESITRLVRRCLTKDRQRRLGDAGAARLEIDDAAARPAPSPTSRPSLPGPVWSVWWLLGAGLVVLAALGFAAWTWTTTSTDAPSSMQIELSLPPEQRLVLTGFNRALMLSPDGRLLAFVGRSGQGRQLYLKRSDDFTATPVSGTDGATFPFFSPDGESLGFFAGGELRRISTTGGNAFTVCQASGTIYGASWGPDSDIVFAIAETGLQVVTADGGEPTLLTELDARTGDAGHVLPHFLPDGAGVLFTQLRPGEPNIALWSRDTGEWRVILERGTGAQLLPGGHLVYARQGTLLVALFDETRGQVTGSSVPTLNGVYTSYFIPSFAVSASGTLVYVPAPDADRLMWVDHAGAATPAIAERGAYEHPRVSPDGRRIAVDFGRGGNRQVWIFDSTRGSRGPLTTTGDNFLSLWTPDGERVAFASLRTGRWDLFWKAADGSGETEVLLEAPYAQALGSFAPDGRLAYYEVHPETARDLWTLMPGSEPEPFLITPFNEAGPSFSPDGRWVAYSSDQSERMEIYLRPFPESEPRAQVTTDGGWSPFWGPDGDRLFYRNGLQVLTVTVQTDPEPVFGTPEPLFEGSYDLTAAGDPHYSATPNRERFLMVTEHSATTVRMVLNWLSEVERATGQVR